MITTRRALALALVFPILSLGALVLYKRHTLRQGQEFVLPITGYDPRDLLAGHYLIYQVVYGIDGLCAEQAQEEQAYVCLDPKGFTTYPPEPCETMIAGVCRGGRFEAGIERFYIPEGQALDLEKRVMGGEASIRIAVLRNGRAQVKDLLINGKSWRD